VPRGARDFVEWGNERFRKPGNVNEGFYRISGITGSGKSHLVKLFVLDALRELLENDHAKLVLYDPKREFFAWLSSLGLSCPIHYFLPNDTRSVAFDFGYDYPEDSDAFTLAHAFYPEPSQGTESPFWGNTLRTIFASVFIAVKKKLGHADLRLVCLVLEDPDVTREVLNSDVYLVQARQLVARTGQGNVSETAQNIQLSIQSRIGELKGLAAQMDCAQYLFSLRRFIDEPKSSILVISKASTQGNIQDPMNGVLFLRLTQLLGDEQSHKKRKLFVVIDEFPTLAGEKSPCPGVQDMFLRLRSRGVRPLVTDQGLTSLTPIYGEDTTSSLLGQCTNVIYLAQPDDKSADAAARDLGIERGIERLRSTNYGGEYASISMNSQRYERPIIQPEVLRNLSLASPETGVEGAARSALNPAKRPWLFTIPPEDIDAIPERDEGVPEYIKRGSEAQRLRDLTEPELERLLGPNAKRAEVMRWLNR
jgi:type IV secretory pathway TraG/TraD family ATPase VirD4